VTRFRRLLVMFLIACVLAVVAGCAHRRASHADVLVSTQCRSINPDDNPILWWWFGCGEPVAGGGESGAG
jgi:hypothetical protein